jgi:hypothetical protein
MPVPNWLKAEITQRLILHTAQAIGGAITATSVDVPALSRGELSVDSFAQLAAGVVIQTATVGVSQLVAKIRARRAKRKEIERLQSLVP